MSIDLAQARLDVTERRAVVRSFNLLGSMVLVYPDPDVPEDEWETATFEGLTPEQLVPFAEVVLYELKVPVPTIVCPTCRGSSSKFCSGCGGAGKVLPSQVSSEQAAASPSLNRYRGGS